jgi:hypothetical protein
MDKWNGFGRAIFKDGSYHLGYWKNDKKYGCGTTYRFDKKSGNYI